MIKLKIITVCAVCILLTCATKHSARTTFTDLQPIKIIYKSLHLSEAKALENEEGGTEKNMGSMSYALGEAFYPNKCKYPLTSGIVYTRTEKPYFATETQYYADERNDSIRAVFYEWNPITEGKYSNSQKETIFRNKFDALKSSISNELGAPSSEDAESQRKPREYRDQIHWVNKKGATVYVLLFGGNAVSYHQIRISVYWK